MTTQSFQLRAFTPADSAAVVDLINAESARTVGFPRAVVDAVGNIRHYRYVPLNSEKVVAVDAQNRVIGYAYLADRDSSVSMETGGAVHHDHWGQGVGQELLAWGEERARVLSEQAPAGVRTVLQVNLFENESSAIQLFSDSGYYKVREWTHMELLMDAPPTPSLPDGFVMREMDLDNDWDIVGPAMDDAFADHWGTIPAGEFASAEEEDDDDDSDGDDEPSDDSFSNAPGYCFIVLDGDTVAGGVLCNAKLVERNDTGRVGSVFVRGAYRRKKIGQALMQTAFQAFWEKDIRRIILDTDSESFSQSRVFYSGLGMNPYRREFLYEKEICPGREVRRLEK
jgi:GNAT superfamily N-acetyltransferase